MDPPGTREIDLPRPGPNDTPFAPGYARSYALVIGIDTYAPHHADLQNARHDARAVAELLETFGFDVTHLEDQAATRDAILSELRTTLPARLEPDDRLVLFFSGHGAGQPGRTEDFGYLVPFGARKAYGDYLSMRELIDVWDRIEAKHLLLILDCCFSGLAAAFKASAAPLPPADYKDAYVAQVTGRAAFQVLTAGTQNELAYDIRDTERQTSVFTAALLDGLRGAAVRNPEGYLTATELAEYVRPRVAEETTRRFGRGQTPYFTDLPGSEQGNVVFAGVKPREGVAGSDGPEQGGVARRSPARGGGEGPQGPGVPGAWWLYGLLALVVALVIYLWVRIF